jgi:hypothetical protein
MPTKKLSPIEEHFEKGLLGIAALVLIYILIAYAISSPTSIQLGSGTVKPGQASAMIRQQAEQLDATAKQRESDWPEIKLPQSQGDAQTSLAALPESSLKPLVPVALPNKEMEDRTPPDIPIIKEKYVLPKVLPVTKLTTTNGRSTVDVNGDMELQDLLGTDQDQVDVSWAAIAGEIDLEKQRLELEKLPEKIEKEPMFIRVDIQRAPVDDQGKVIGEWQDVPFPYSDSLVITSEESLKVDSMDDLRSLRNEVFSQLSQVESSAMMPEFPTVLYGSEWTPPLLPGEKKPVVEATRKPRERRQAVQPARRQRVDPGMGVGGPGGRASRRMGGGGPGMMPGGPGGPAMGGGVRRTNRAGGRTAVGGPGMGMDPAMIGPGMPPGAMDPAMMGLGMPGEMGMGGRGRMQQPRQVTVQKLTNEERRLEKKLKIWAIDLFGVPGQTYKYRIRPVMYNPLAGYKLYLKDPSNTLLAGIAGPWAEVSEPVKLDHEYYCFVDGLGNDKKTAKFTVIKWHLGSLYSEVFIVKEGEAIGDKKKVKLLPVPGQNAEDLGFEELDFNMGWVLAEISPGSAEREVNVTIQTSDGQSLQQNSIRIKESEDYKKSQDMLRDQRVRIGKMMREMRSVR